MQKGYFKGIIAGAIMGAFAGMLMKPQRKLELGELKQLAEEAKLPKMTKTFLKGVSKRVRKGMK